MFLLQGSVPNKFYVHNDIFRYEDEVFGDSEGELDEGEKDSCVGFVSFLFLSLCAELPDMFVEMLECKLCCLLWGTEVLLLKLCGPKCSRK